MRPPQQCYSVLVWFSCGLVTLCWSVLWQVAPAVKTLSSEQLAQFQERGEIVVEGHTLTLEDIKVHAASCYHGNNYRGTIIHLLYYHGNKIKCRYTCPHNIHLIPLSSPPSSSRPQYFPSLIVSPSIFTSLPHRLCLNLSLPPSSSLPRSLPPSLIVSASIFPSLPHRLSLDLSLPPSSSLPRSFPPSFIVSPSIFPSLPPSVDHIRSRPIPL